jgi:hypothetical protein
MNGDVTTRYNPASDTDCHELDEEESIYPSDCESVMGDEEFVHQLVWKMQTTQLWFRIFWRDKIIGKH